MSDAPISFSAAVDEIRPIAYPTAELTDLAANETANPNFHPRNRPHEILARLDGTGSMMSLARTRKSTSATKKRLPSVEAMASFIQPLISSPHRMKDTTTAAETARNRRNARKGNALRYFLRAFISPASIRSRCGISCCGSCRRPHCPRSIRRRRARGAPCA